MLTAGTTVVIGMLVLLVLRQALLNGVAIVATVAMTVLASLTLLPALLPALLGFTGNRLGRPLRLNTFFIGKVLINGTLDCTQLVAFARLSQYADGKTGIDTQDEDDRGWAAANGHQIIQMVVDHISGRVSPLNRRNAGKWLRDPALMAIYDGILVARIDRLTRNRDRDIRQWAEEYGKKIIIVNPTLIWPPEPGDIATPIIWDNLVNIAASE